MEQMIRKVISTLDRVEVRGRENLDRLLGCMQALEKIAEAARKAAETAQSAEKE